MPTKRPTIAELQAEISRKDKAIEKHLKEIRQLSDDNMRLAEETNQGLIKNMAVTIERQEDEIRRLKDEVKAIKEAHSERIDNLKDRVEREFELTPKIG